MAMMASSHVMRRLYLPPILGLAPQADAAAPPGPNPDRTWGTPD